MPKTSILVIFGQKGPFWTVFGQNGQNGENYQKSAWNIFFHLQALTNCKVSEKSNERFPRKSVVNGRTYVRTNMTPKVSNDHWSRDQKKLKIFRTISKLPKGRNNLERLKLKKSDNSDELI